MLKVVVATLLFSSSALQANRRGVLGGIGGSALGLSGLAPAANAKGGPKVVVVGGAGFVGSHVTQELVARGASVVSISRSSPDAQGARVAKSVGALKGVTYESLDASAADLGAAFKGAAAVVSCVGVVPGGKNQLDGNGKVNVKIAEAAKSAKVPRIVYVSVASAISSGPGKFIFGDYMKGKAQSEAAVNAAYPSSASMILRPAIISGGPPGPPGPPGVPPVPVDAVAKAAAAGALGKKSGVFDGAAAILAAAQ